MNMISALCIGDELLDGRIRDENASWLARFSTDQGFQLQSIHIIGDDMDAIINALEARSRRCDILVVCGGMGPTEDDITRNAAAKWVGAPLQVDEATLSAIKKRFEARGYTFTPNNHSQCLFPAGAEILATEVGTAAGFSLKKNDCQVFFLPGVPAEYRWFVQNRLLRRLVPSADKSHKIYREKLSFFGAGESWLENRLAGIEPLAGRLGARVGYLAQSPVIEIHLKAPSQEAIDELRDFILPRVGKWLIAEGQETLSKRLCALLGAREATVTTAESCTAGLVAARLAEVPGASAWFERGFITYANAAKAQILGVRPEIIDEFGAVSAQTACQMAAGARKAAGATFALATTGFAGPTGGSPEKPVGTVHFALAAADGVWHYGTTFSHRTRPQVLTASVYTALSLLLWHLEARLDEHHVDGPFDDAAVWAASGVPVDAP